MACSDFIRSACNSTTYCVFDGVPRAHRAVPPENRLPPVSPDVIPYNQPGKGTVQEPPHFKRSALWRHQRQIAAWLQEGYSFRQIATELTRQGTHVSTRWLQEWYAKNVGPRRSRPRTGAGAGRPAHSAAPPPGTPPPEAPGMNPSPAPQACTAPSDPDFSALFQAQFKRPRK
jgi:hypothetical protein